MGRESPELTLTQFLKLPLPPPLPKNKPLDVHVARAAANNLILNTVNLSYEIREIVVAQGIQFHNEDIRVKSDEVFPDPQTAAQMRDQFVIPLGLQDDFPDIVLRGNDGAVFISDAQHVEFHIRVVRTKKEFKEALETAGIHVIYAGHSRFGRGPCFGPDLGKPPDLKGENWEIGTAGNTDSFGIFRMGFPFVGAPFKELDEHQYRMRPVPTSQKINPADVNPTTSGNRLKPVDLRGSRFEPLIENMPVADSYWGCQTHDGEGVLLFADWTKTRSAPMDLGATNIMCRCFTVLGCDTFKHFHEIVRKRKGFKRTDSDGFAYFTVEPVPIAPATKNWISSILEYPERNDFQSWLPSLEFAVKRTNQKAALDPDFKYHFV